MRSSERRPLALLTALICLCLLPVISPTRADTAAGAQAFDKGDYARAMSEWQTAADRGDAEAQLGLGKLYEFGLGDLAQDYKRADFWYRKAADQNNAEAQYRLALICVVGGDDFPPDLTEAYKWLSLVLDSKGVWGTRAAELKPQFDRLVGTAAKAEGTQRAAAWREAHTAKTNETAAAGGTSPPTPTPAPALPSSKCVGWPFPTLPCTEEFPAFPGAKPQQVVVPPIPAQNAVGTPAVTLASPSASSAPPAGPRDKASASVDCSASAAQRSPPALCHAFAELDAMRVAGLVSDGNLGLRLPDGTTQLHQGDLIKVEIRAPAYAVNLRVDYFSLNGQVLHLWPNSDETEAYLAARATHVYGEAGARKVWAVGGAPFGTELITVIATAAPLDLGGSRRPVELADDYLRDLKAALARARAPVATPNIVATLPVQTSAH